MPCKVLDILREFRSSRPSGSTITNNSKTTSNNINNNNSLPSKPSQEDLPPPPEMDQVLSAIYAWSQGQDQTRAFEDLVAVHATSMARECWGNQALTLACRQGCLPFVRALFDASASRPALRREILALEARKWPAHQSVGEAALGNHLDVLDFLLRQDGIDAHILAVDDRGNNALHRAADPLACDPRVFSALIDRSRTAPFQLNADNDTPLDLLTDLFPDRVPGALDCIRVLLTQGRAGPQGGHLDRRRQPLPKAVLRGNMAVAESLIRDAVGGEANATTVLRPKQGGGFELIDEEDVRDYLGEDEVNGIVERLARANGGGWGQ